LDTEVAQAIAGAVWRRDHKLSEHDNDEGTTARAYIGEISGWRLLVVGWTFADRNGKRADGTAIHPRGLVLRLSREQAAEAYRVAEEKTDHVK
jgi:hypothetical protein